MEKVLTAQRLKEMRNAIHKPFQTIVNERDALLFEQFTRGFKVETEDFGTVKIPYVVSDAVPIGMAIMSDAEKVLILNMQTHQVHEYEWSELFRATDTDESG